MKTKFAAFSVSSGIPGLDDARQEPGQSMLAALDVFVVQLGLGLHALRILQAGL
jgi:hypothetical protein